MERFAESPGVPAVETHVNYVPAGKPDLTWQTLDSNGDRAPVSCLGCVYRHSGNGHEYNVVGITWLCDTDEWAIVYRRPGIPIPFTRSLRNSMGVREDGQRRFVLVSSPKADAQLLPDDKS